jgi:hypothetical protein
MRVMQRASWLGAALAAFLLACGSNDSKTETDAGDPGGGSGAAEPSAGPGGAGPGGAGGGPSGTGGGPSGTGGGPTGTGGDPGAGGVGPGPGAGGDGGAGGATGTGGESVGGAGPGGAGGGVAGCLDAEDCANNGSQICDPPTKTCAAPQCSVASPTCPNPKDLCLIQFPNSNNAACYPSCQPFSATCPSGQDCLDATGEGMVGACVHVGTHKLGDACSQHDVTSDCVVGHDCRDQGQGQGPECLQHCNYWGPSASCTDPVQHCHFMGLCLDTPGSVDPAGIGGACSVNATKGQSCAKVGDEINGSCQDTGQAELVCLKHCRMSVATDCAAPQVCNAFPAPWELFGVCF